MLRRWKMEEKVRAVLDKVRPNLQADGGDVELVEVTAEGVVRVRLKGACRGCPMSQMTLKRGIENAIKSEVPEVLRVEGVD
jgi:Fe-S cluster biogenesis protein NfuA